MAPNSKNFPNAAVDEFTVMPNHIHGIVMIHENVVIVGAKHPGPYIGNTYMNVSEDASPLRMQPMRLMSVK